MGRLRSISGIACLTLHFATITLTVAQSPLTSLPVTINEDSSFDFELLVLLGLGAYDGAGIGDVLAAAKVIEPLNMTSYNETFYTLATAIEAEAPNYTSKGASQAKYFAASSYYRNADFYNHGNWSDPLINAYWDKQTKCFDEAIASLPVPGERVTLNADGFEVVGIFYGQPPSNLSTTSRRPTLLLGNGYDGAQEDSLHQSGFEALKRGWNVMTYEGPGQPTVRRGQGLGFIPQWEKVATPCVDYLASRPDVDMSRLALMGLSMGGYLAARAAAFEPRVKALVLNGGVWSLFDGFTGQFPPKLMDVYYSGNRTLFDAVVEKGIVNNDTAPTSARWGMQQGLWSFNETSPFALLKATEAYTIANISDRIKMPTFVANSVNDGFFPGQGVHVAQALGSHATLHNFTGPASYHCQVGAFWESNQVYFDWLENTFNITGETVAY